MNTDQTAPELVLTFWITWKHYGKTERSKVMNGTQSEADDLVKALSLTPAVSDIKLEWER